MQVISELCPFERQRYLPIHYQNKSFRIKNSTRRRVFARRHFEAGQYVAQSGLHLHQTEPQSCEQNQKTGCQAFVNKCGFSIHLSTHFTEFTITDRGHISWLCISNAVPSSNADVRRRITILDAYNTREGHTNPT